MNKHILQMVSSLQRIFRFYTINSSKLKTKRIVLLIGLVGLFLISTRSYGQFATAGVTAFTEPFNIWPGSAPGSENLTISESFTIRTPTAPCDEDRTVKNILNPQLVPYFPKTPNGTSVIICPGGGYSQETYDVEGTDIAQWLNSLNITAFILKYRLPNNSHINKKDVPLQDAQRAVRVIRQNAAAWGLNANRIGIIGFSAGGHVASSLAVNYDKVVYTKKDAIDNLSAKPNLAMLVYALISMETSITHDGARTNLIGSSPTLALINEYSNEKHITTSTPPTFLAHSIEDGSVDVANSQRFYDNIPQSIKAKSTLKKYTSGKHGIGICKASGTDFANWTTDAEAWLNSGGFLAPGNTALHNNSSQFSMTVSSSSSSYFVSSNDAPGDITSLSIVSIVGSTIFNAPSSLLGQSLVELNKSIFPNKGIYFVIASIGERQSSYKLLVK